MKLQFSITITAGWNVVTKGNSLSGVLFFCGLRADCLKSKVTSDKELSIYFFEALFKVSKALFKCCL